MTQPKLDPAELRLRPAPPPVTRLSRRALAALSGIGGLVVLGLVIWALDPPRLFGPDDAPELYDTNPRSGAGLETLPRDYAAIPRPEPPRLGPPLPGDLGRPLLSARERGALSPVGPTDSDALRRVQEAETAARSGVFFQIRTRGTERGIDVLSRDVAGPGSEGSTAGLGPTGGEFAPVPAAQGTRLAFFGAPVDRAIYSPQRLQRPVSGYQLMAGTVIAASLLTGIDADLPGLVEAQVTEHVHATVTGRHCLVPQGSRLIGRYDSQVAFGQRRVLLVWSRLIRPDGSSIVLDNLPGTDEAGYAGLEDGVDWHWGRIVAAAAVSTLLGIGTELRTGSDEAGIARALRRGLQGTTSDVGQEIVRRNLDVQPTLTVRPGWPLRVIVAKDIVLPPMASPGGATCRA